MNISTPEQIIYHLALTIAPKYIFAHYTREDLIQEAYIMGMDAYTRYDGIRPLENFIARHISNRLKTFKRDKYFRPDAGSAETLQLIKKALACPGNIEKIQKTYLVDYADIVGVDEQKEKLNITIPPSYRRDYLRLLAGVRISPIRKAEIINIIRILEKGGLRG